jgi:hypothetical protein
MPVKPESWADIRARAKDSPVPKLLVVRLVDVPAVHTSGSILAQFGHALI